MTYLICGHCGSDTAHIRMDEIIPPDVVVECTDCHNEFEVDADSAGVWDE